MTEQEKLLARIKQLVSYDPLTGVFTRKVALSTRTNVGDIMGSRTLQGYLTFMVDRKVYRANRLAYFYMTGEWPKGVVDHVNEVKSDNRWSNLRDVTNLQNCQNVSKPRRNNATGYLGVHLHRKTNKFRALLTANGLRVDLGLFTDPEIAHQAYLQAKKIYHPIVNKGD